jgi:hypothetical protein
MLVNYKTIIQDLSGISYYHPQINSFGFGDITQITADVETKLSPVYPKAYVVPSTVNLAQNRLLYNFSVIIMDRVNEKTDNLEDIMSDTLEIAKDFFTVLYQSYAQQYGGFSVDYTPLWGPNVTPFLERFEDIVAGWTLNIQIEQPFDYNQCVLPFTSGATLPTPQEIFYVNYKQLLGDIQNLANNHPQVNSYGYGDLTELTVDLNTKLSPVYPKVYAIPQDTILDQNQLTYNFQIIVADRLNEDYSNQRDLMNDTLEICKDLFTKLYLSEYQSQWNASVEPFLERFDDILAGWTMNITLTQPFDYNRCVLPEQPFAGNKKWYELAELWNEINKKWKKI